MLVCYHYETYYHSNIRKPFTITKIQKKCQSLNKNLCFHSIMQWCYLSGFSSMTFIARSWILKEIFMQFEKLPTRLWCNMTNGGKKKKSFHACNNLSALLKKQKAIQTQFLSVKAVGSSWGCAFAPGIWLEGESEDRFKMRVWWWEAWDSKFKISPIRLPWLMETVAGKPAVMWLMTSRSEVGHEVQHVIAFTA